jgi:DNA-binding NarL/FixJ family response regulator
MKTPAMSTEPGRAKAKVFLVDDHALVREHLTALIQAQDDLAVCGEAEEASTALSLIGQHEPDLVVLDISLRQSSGLDLLEGLKKLRRKPAVLVLSMHEERLYAERSFRAGALGYITKEDATVNIIRAMRQVLLGQSYLSERIAEQMREQSRAIQPNLVEQGRR